MSIEGVPAIHAAARRHPREVCGRRTPLAVLALLALLLVSVPAVGLQETEAGARHILVLVPDEPAQTTVLQRVHLSEAVAGNATVRIAVPVGADQHEVKDQDAGALSWSESARGVLDVGLAGETAWIDVASRGIAGPEAGRSLRFGAQDPADPFWLVIAVAPELKFAAFGLDPVSLEELRASPAVVSTWPFPSDSEYFYNQGQDDRVPSVIRMEVGTSGAALAPYALGVALAVLLGLFTVWLAARIHKGVDDPTRTRKQPVMKHLEELRARFVIVTIVLFLATAFFFSFGFRWATILGQRLPVPLPAIHGNAASQVFAWLAERIVPSGVEVVVVAPFDAVVTLLLLSFALGVLVVFPVLFYHAYAFLAPALYPHERRVVMIASPVVVGLFGAGAAFGLLLMAPLIVLVLYGFAAAAGATAFLTMPQLVTIAALLAVVFAVAFQLPLVMMLTARIGIVRAAAYRRQWRWAVVIIVIVSAMVTDPTVVTQLIVAAVLMVLYGVGLLLAWMVDRKRDAPDSL